MPGHARTLPLSARKVTASLGYASSRGLAKWQIYGVIVNSADFDNWYWLAALSFVHNGDVL
jgi:hypothetical protein